MRLPHACLALSALAAAWLASPARAQTTLTSGNATFTFNGTPTAENAPTYEADFRTDGASVDHLYAQWMFYRVSGDTRTRPFGNYTKSGGGTVAVSGTASGNTMTYNVTETAPGGTTRFAATWTLTLQDGATPGKATVLHSLTVTNPTATDLTISLIHFLDYDLGEIATSHSATGGVNKMTIARGVYGGSYTPGTTASQYQAAETGTIDTGFLNGTAMTLNGTGLPFTGDDWTGAYQWDLVVPANGGTATILFEMGVSPVPEPGSVLALAAAGLGLVGVVRRARLASRG